MKKEPFPGFKAAKKAREIKSRAYGAANADPLPGPLADAFAGLPEEIGGLRVRPIYHADFPLLKLLKSPLLDLISGDKSKVPWTDEIGYAIIWQFTRPIEEVDAFIRRQPPARAAAAVQEAARQACLKLAPLEVPLLVKAVQRSLVRSFSTVLQFSEKDPNTKTFFPTPPATTAPAGGSTTSAA